MSLLVDLLSKTKTKELRKDIPPDLRKAVVQGAYRRKSRRKFIFLSILVLIVFLAGFATIYFMEMFKTSLSTSIAAKTPLRRPPAPPIIPVEQPVNPAKTEAPVYIATVMPKVFLPDSDSQRKVQPVKESSHEVAENPNKESKTVTQTTTKTQELTKVKPPETETLSTEKTQQKTNKDVYLFVARTHEAKGEYKQAIDYYLKALELEPTNYIVMNNISGVYIRLKLFKEALSYANKALDIKTNYIPSLINAGISHVSLDSLGEGGDFLAKAVTLEPLNKVALFNLGVLCEKQGNYDKAFENYFKLSQLRDVDGCLGAARILERQGRDSETARFYREILTIETASASVRQFANLKLAQLARKP